MLGKQYLKYVSSNILGMMGLSFYILADTYFVAARLGADGLAALCGIPLPSHRGRKNRRTKYLPKPC